MGSIEAQTELSHTVGEERRSAWCRWEALSQHPTTAAVAGAALRSRALRKDRSKDPFLPANRHSRTRKPKGLFFSVYFYF